MAKAETAVDELVGMIERGGQLRDLIMLINRRLKPRLTLKILFGERSVHPKQVH